MTLRETIQKDPLFNYTASIVLLLSLWPKGFHDYGAYIVQWKAILNGEEPYHAYGIFYNFFSLPYWLYFKLPNFIFVGTYLFAVKQLTSLQPISNTVAKQIKSVLLFNPIFLIFGVIYGSNDTFLAGVSALSIIYFIKSEERLAGSLLASGITFKYTPVLITPFLALKKRKLAISFIVSLVSIGTLIALIGYFFWGEFWLLPFKFGAERSSKTLSIFRFIRGDLQPLQFLNITDLDRYSVVCIILAWLASFLTYFLFKLDRYLLMLFAYSNVLLFYKVGHHQFYMFLLFMSMLCYVNYSKTIKQDFFLKFSGMLFWGWIFLATLAYPLTGGYRGNFIFVREFIGGPTFFVHLLFNIAILRHAFSLKKETKR